MHRWVHHCSVYVTSLLLVGAFALAQEAIRPDTLVDVKPLEAAGIHNLFALGTNIYSGSAPEGEDSLHSHGLV